MVNQCRIKMFRSPRQNYKMGPKKSSFFNKIFSLFHASPGKYIISVIMYSRIIDIEYGPLHFIITSLTQLSRKVILKFFKLTEYAENTTKFH